MITSDSEDAIARSIVRKSYASDDEAREANKKLPRSWYELTMIEPA
jgi:hypothetical protein